jgi:zinc transport system substrate-binding protein
MRTRIILIACGLAGAAALAAGCGPGGRGSASGKERIVAGFYPLAFAARAVGGGRVSVRDMTPPGAEPHDLEVSPRDVGDLESAQLVLLLGRGFQPQLEGAAGHSSRVLRLLDVPAVHAFPDGDPHVWLDPSRFARIVRRVAAALRRPRAAQALVRRLNALDAEYRRGLAHCARHSIVTSHEAFRYLARRYGLQQVAISGIAPDAEPTPRTLQRVVATVRRTHAATVYSEPLVSPRLARTIARETGAQTAILDPIEALTSAEQARGDDYFSLMRQNLAKLRTGLACR